MGRLGRVVLVVSCVVATAAHADERLDLRALPDEALVETVFHLDRHVDHAKRTRSGLAGSLGYGVGDHPGADPAVAAATLSAGHRDDRLIAVTHGELLVTGREIDRARVRGIVELRHGWNEEFGWMAILRGSGEHGNALGLAPARLGPGRRDHGELQLDGMATLGSRGHDGRTVGIVRGETSATRWLSAPALDRAERSGLGLGVGRAPDDGELPRGVFEFLRGRVEHVRIHRPFIGAGVANLDTSVRTVEIGTALNEFTAHIDHELLVVSDVDLGWSWLEADTNAGRIADNAFRMRLGTSLAYRDDKGVAMRRVGVAVARTPTTTPDGQRIVGEWRAELATGVETSRVLLDARGGVSWLVPFAGGRSVETLVRYGIQLEAFAKLGAGIELGTYHARAYESPIAGDPWASARRWNTETGVMARWRP